MKPPIPPVPLPVWGKLYDAALEFHKLRPWEILDDLDLVGVRDPSGETGYAVVMGSGGTLFGLCVYRGAEGFDLYRRLVSGESDPFTDDAFAVNDCLKLELGAKRDLQSEDIAVIRQLGRTFKGAHAWPEFRNLEPGYLPWFLTEAEARFMTLALGAVLSHCANIGQGKIGESYRGDECLVYSLKENDFEFQWEPAPVFTRAPDPPPVLNVTRINAIRAKPPKRDSPWEADVFYLPSPISEGKPPYYMRVAVACQQSSGFTFAFDVLKPHILPAQALADLLCASVEKHSFLPDVVFVRDNEIANALAPLGKALGIAIHPQEHLETVRFLRTDLERQLMKDGRTPSALRSPKQRRHQSPPEEFARPPAGRHGSIYQMKVTLRGSDPRIWRRFLVPADYTLEKLHRVLQVVMGWSNYHLHEFTVGGVSYGRPHPDFGDRMLNDRRVRLQEIPPRTSFIYIYDFGDGWQHELKVEKVLVAQEGEHYPRCVEGKRACPPEDSGGIGRFADLLEAIRRPVTEEQRELVAWAEDFVPDLFDIEAANKRLRRMR